MIGNTATRVTCIFCNSQKKLHVKPCRLFPNQYNKFYFYPLVYAIAKDKLLKVEKKKIKVNVSIT